MLWKFLWVEGLTAAMCMFVLVPPLTPFFCCPSQHSLARRPDAPSPLPHPKRHA